MLLNAWHLLSLDAVTVAILWALLLGRAGGEKLIASELLLLGLGTWLLYVGDRLLDGRTGQDRARMRERHLFYARHLRVALACCGTVAGLTAYLALSVPPRLCLAYTCLLAASMLYLVFVHGVDPTRSKRPSGSGGVARKPAVRFYLKEAAVGILFSAAAAAPAWTAQAAPLGVLLPATLLFALLCWLNCTAIELWERGRRYQVSPYAAIMALLAGIAACLPGMATVGLAAAGSALLLLAFDRTRLSAWQLRILADVALLTPLAALLW